MTNYSKEIKNPTWIRSEAAKYTSYSQIEVRRSTKKASVNSHHNISWSSRGRSSSKIAMCGRKQVRTVSCFTVQYSLLNSIFAELVCNSLYCFQVTTLNMKSINFIIYIYTCILEYKKIKYQINIL